MDKQLKIQTTGRDDSKEDTYHHPYEPTPYTVLERLAESEYITGDSILVDYGCGKGRVDFYLSAKVGCETIGIDFDERMIKKALENNRSFVGKSKSEFLCISAENYVSQYILSKYPTSMKKGERKRLVKQSKVII